VVLIGTAADSAADSASATYWAAAAAAAAAVAEEEGVDGLAPVSEAVDGLERQEARHTLGAIDVQNVLKHQRLAWRVNNSQRRHWCESRRTHALWTFWLRDDAGQKWHASTGIDERSNPSSTAAGCNRAPTGCVEDLHRTAGFEFD
jgi:hypothetical protein